MELQLLLFLTIIVNIFYIHYIFIHCISIIIIYFYITYLCTNNIFNFMHFTDLYNINIYDYNAFIRYWSLSILCNIINIFCKYFIMFLYTYCLAISYIILYFHASDYLYNLSCLHIHALYEHYYYVFSYKLAFNNTVIHFHILFVYY